MLQLDPAIPVVTPNGKALAHIVIDYGPEHDLLWVCFQDNGEIWTYRNQDVRADTNITFGRKPGKTSEY
jgi:hypothetical protein